MLFFECLNIHQLYNSILAKKYSPYTSQCFINTCIHRKQNFHAIYYMILISQYLSHSTYACNDLLTLLLLDYKARSRVRHTERKTEFLLNFGPIRNVNDFEIQLIFPQPHAAKAS